MSFTDKTLPTADENKITIIIKPTKATLWVRHEHKQNTHNLIFLCEFNSFALLFSQHNLILNKQHFLEGFAAKKKKLWTTLINIMHRMIELYCVSACVCLNNYSIKIDCNWIRISVFPSLADFFFLCSFSINLNAFFINDFAQNHSHKHQAWIPSIFCLFLSF